MTPSALGRSVQRLDIRTKVQGTRKYPQDFDQPGQLYGAVVWSDHPHARVLRIDTSAARATPGVVRVLTADDVPVNEYGINICDQPVLVPVGGKVRWLGDRLAIVVAETERAARQAAGRVRVDYELLAVVSDPREAMGEGSPLVHEEKGTNILRHIRVRKGDVEAAFARADVVVEDVYTTHCVEHAYLQPDAGIGYIDEQGRVTVIASAQWPHDDLHQIAHMLDLPEDRLREIVPAVGGAFGGREDMHIQHLLALCAYVVRRPVKIVFTREEVMRCTGKRHPFYFRCKHGATRDGKLIAMEIEGISDAGAYASTSIPVLSNAVTFMAGPYVIPNARIDGYTVYTNNAVGMAMRGFGATQPPVAYEQQVDRLAAALGMDPVEFRLKNMIGPGSETVLGNRMPPGTGIRETLIEAARAAGWREEGGHWVRPQVGEPSLPHRRRGIGLASAYKNVCYSLGYGDKSSADVELVLGETGQIDRVVVKIGAAEVGQGVHTVLQQIAAEALGVDPAQVRISLVDTANVPDAGSSSASRHTYASGNAVLGACRLAREKWQRSLREETGETRIAASYTFYARDQRATTPFDPESGQCEPHVSYSFGTQVALVEVDVETGEVELLRMWASNDLGRVINPQMVFGQVAGGIHMGVGYALMENYIQEEGRNRSRRLSEYAIPSIKDMPAELINVDVEVSDPTGPFGAKGLGETPTLATAPAILNAIADAVGVRITDLPATPERVWRALQGRCRPRRPGERKDPIGTSGRSPRFGVGAGPAPPPTPRRFLMPNVRLRFILAGLSIVILAAGLLGPAQPTTADEGKIDAEVLAHLDGGAQGVFLAYMAEQADLSPAYHIRDWSQRGRFVYNALREVADRTQPAVLAALSSLQAKGHVSEAYPHYIVNAVLVRGDAAAARALARLPQVAAVYPEIKIELVRPVEMQPAEESPETVEWNIAKIRADQVWSTYGVTGTGVVVANIDTGVQYNHPALVNQYRGSTGGSPEHDYNWWDPTDQYDYPYPIEGSHGTHTMGTMVGEAGGNQIGVAPGAKWIAAYGCCPSNEALLSASEWMIAPWQVNDFDPDHPTADPDKRPHVVNNSWGGPGGSLIFEGLLEAQRAAGIFPAFSAGNNGSACGTLGSPGDNPAAFNSAATDSSDNIAGFSSRGPDPFHAWFGLYEVGPDLAAPGVSVRSSIPTNSYAYSSGTSMASPHTAGAVALLWSAEPDLIGRLEETEEILRRTAVPKTATQTCGGVPSSQVPNNTYGWGRLDALAAVGMIWHAGMLSGTITGAATAAPVPGAQVLVQRGGYTLTTATDAAGSYELLLGEGTYAVTVRAYGYQPWTQGGVVVQQDVTTDLDVALTPLITHTLSGLVLEGVAKASGDPVSARVGLRDTGVDVATDPSSGAYSTPVAEGSYWMRVLARGYDPAERAISVAGDLTEDWGLQPRWTYYVRDSRSPCGPAFSWIDARDGTAHNVGDDSFFAISLPAHPFTFYGNTYNTYCVGSNGFVSFGQGYTRAHMVFPFEGAANNAIYGFEEDLNPNNGSQGVIYYKMVGDRYLVIEFYRVEHWESGYPETFEFILDTETGVVLLQYQEVSWPDFASVGIENSNGSDGILYSYADSAHITDSLAVGFYPVFGPPPADQDSLGVRGTLSGTIYISGTTTPIPGAVVTATSFLGTLVTATDPGGEYRFEEVCADLYHLQAGATGFLPSSEVEARLRWPGDTAVNDFYLKRVAPSLVKAVSPIQCAEPFTYTLVYGNIGGRPISGVLSDTLPGDVQYITSAPAGLYQNGTLTWTLDIPAGGEGEVTVVVEAVLPPGAPPGATRVPLTNTAVLRWDGQSISSTVVSDLVLFDLYLTKTVSMEHIPPGELVTYTLVYANEGCDFLFGAVLSDVLPSEVDYLTSTPSGLYQDGVLTWTVDLPSGGGGEVTVVGMVRDPAEGGDTPSGPGRVIATNRAYLLWAGPTVSDSASFEVALPYPYLTKTAAMDDIPPGGMVTYTLAYGNEGHQGLVGVVISDVLPVGVAYITSTPPGLYRDGVLTWTVDIPAGWDGEISLVGQLTSTAAPSTTVYNTAFLLWEGEPLSSIVSSHVHWPPCQPVQDPEIDWSPATPLVGQVVTFSGTAGAGDLPITFAWDLEGVQREGSVVTHTYAEAGTYAIVLTATNCAGAGRASVSDVLTVEPYRIYLPLLFGGMQAALGQTARTGWRR